MHTPPTRTRSLGLGASIVVALSLAACTSATSDATGPGSTGSLSNGTAVSTAGTSSPTGDGCTNEPVAGPDADVVATIVDDAVAADGLQAVLYRVTRGDEVIAAGSVGESLPDEPAAAAMHFRGGNVAFAYLGTLLLLMAESGEVSLDDPISRWLPDLDVPDADAVTLEMLTNNTSGYPDYVRSEAFQTTYLDNPFVGFTPDQLLDFAMATPPWYPPGQGWSYAHTNYQILGAALAAAGGEPLEELLRTRVIEPMGLTGTEPVLGTDLPAPALQTYSAERGVYENTTWWNPSWQTAPGSVLSTDICDLAASARAVGRGDLLTEASYEAMIAPDTAQLPAAPETCPPDVCRQMTADQYYGLGVLVMQDWIVQRPLFGGMGAVQAYLPAQDLSVAVVATAGPDTEVGSNRAQPIWISIAEALTPDAVPSQ